tara:strand:- start:1340 stop:1540 length:201 start_codon:yes stop_codon:yes gene_type:complete
MKWIIEHQKECKILDDEKCLECLHISEAQWALTQAHEEIQVNKKQPKPQVKTKNVYDYRLKEWRGE